MNTRQQCLFFTANLKLQPGIEQMLEQDSYSNDHQANLVPLLIICLCSHWQSWPWLLPPNAPPPISTGAISCEQERNVNDCCRHIAEWQLGLTMFKRNAEFLHRDTQHVIYRCYAAFCFFSAFIALILIHITFCMCPFCVSAIITHANAQTHKIVPWVKSFFFKIKPVYDSPLTD